MIHLSDIHFKIDKNPFLAKVDSLINAVQNYCLEYDSIFVILTGDIANSGKSDEYLKATLFLDEFVHRLYEYCNKEINIIMVPGNHDCDHDSTNSSVRNVIVDSIIENGVEGLDGHLIDNCCTIQKEWFELYKTYCDSGINIFSSPLLNITEYNIEGLKLLFYEYNTAWISKKKEIYGKVYFPYDYFSKDLFINEADLSISILHHPLNWQPQLNQQKFKDHLENTSDIVITGHEHLPSSSERTDLKGTYTKYIEGAVLQDNANDNNSGFNLILIDLEEKTHKIEKYSWNRDFYSCKDSVSDWISYKKYQNNNKDDFNINENFILWLNDPGANFTHYKKSKLMLQDIFIWPHFEDINKVADETIDTTNYDELIVDGSILNNINKDFNKTIILGDESSGKSTLCKSIYKNYYNQGYVPIYIEGNLIKSDKCDNFKKILHKKFGEQYKQNKLEKYQQLSNNKKLIIIDDINTSRLSSNYKGEFIKMISKLYDNIIITADTLFQMEEIIQNESEGNVIYDDFVQYKIKEFGHFKRESLIKKWHKLGAEKLIEDFELIRKLDKSKGVINRIIGNNFIPSYPIYLLTILQTEHMGQSHDLKNSTYGHYYSYLITHSLGKSGVSRDKLDLYYSYLSEMTYYMFENDLSGMSKEKYQKFHDDFCEEYSISLSFEEISNDLCDAALLENVCDHFRVKYKYVYYYFVADYLANNINNTEKRDLIVELCKESYVEENANIILFLTHHSKDPLILESLVKNAINLFKQISPIKFNNDIKPINELLKRLPEIAYKEIKITKYREKQAKKIDKYEYRYEDENNVAATKEDLGEEDNSEMDYVSELNFVFKTIEILGQVLKNYYGSMKGKQKYHIAYNIYMLSLRTLNSMFNKLTQSKDFFINNICKKAEKKGFQDKEKIKEIVGEFLFKFAEFLSFSVIKKTSNAIGTENLSQTFNEIIENNEMISVKLIDVSIKLDFFRTFPFDEIEKLVVQLKNNLLPMSLLKRFVLEHLYMFDELNHREKQKLCNLLDISIKTQLAINRKSTRKKKIE